MSQCAIKKMYQPLKTKNSKNIQLTEEDSEKKQMSHF